MTPDDIPTSVTKLVYTAPTVGGPASGIRNLSQNEIAEQLAHYWPAIEAHIRERVAREIEDGIPTWEGMGERASDRNDMLHIAARIARAGQPPKEQR